MQCGMCGVVWNVLWDSGMLYLNVMYMAWCDVEWCAEMWSDLVGIMVRCVKCDMERCNFRHGMMWKVIEMQNV